MGGQKRFDSDSDDELRDATPVSPRIVSGIIRVRDVFVVLLAAAVAYWI